VRLSDLGTRALTWRRFGVLVRQLPRESALSLAVNGPAATWATTDHLLAVCADRLGQMLWIAAGTRKNPKPQPVPRPEHRSTSWQREQMAQRLLEQQRRRGGVTHGD
jgi:hypothetical protein